MSVLNEKEVLKLLQQEKINRIKQRKLPFHVMRYDFIAKHGKENVIEALRSLVRNQVLEMGSSSSDFYFNPELDDECPEKEIEIKILQYGKFL